MRMHSLCSLLLLAVLAAVPAMVQALPPSSNPFCAYRSARDNFEVTLACNPVNGGVIQQILFAAYGTPRGCPSPAANASCNAANALAVVRSKCVNKTMCSVSASDFGADPCPEVIKAIAIVANCTGPAGGFFVNVVPSCATSDGSPPCPLPRWQPTWAVNRSTICQPGNTAGFLNATEAARWGLISLDWSIANQVWNRGNLMNATGAATLVEQCRQIKAVDPTTKCFVYRNTELALQWLEPQRAVMYDAAFADFFLQYQPGNPQGKPAGIIYNENAGGPGSGFNQFFWNYSNYDAWQYVLYESEMGSLGTGSPYVDGTFLDDSQAIPQEHGNAPTNIGLTPLQLAILQNDTHRFVDKAIATLAENGYFIWQGFNNNPGGDPDSVSPAPDSGSCSGWMEMTCNEAWQSVPMTMAWGATDKVQRLAAFLITRGPYAYMGYGWQGTPLPAWDPIWDQYDVGEPMTNCTQVQPGIYVRKYTKGNATLNCNNWTAQLTF